MNVFSAPMTKLITHWIQEIQPRPGDIIQYHPGLEPEQVIEAIELYHPHLTGTYIDSEERDTLAHISPLWDRTLLVRIEGRDPMLSQLKNHLDRLLTLSEIKSNNARAAENWEVLYKEQLYQKGVRDCLQGYQDLFSEDSPPKKRTHKN